MNNEIWLWLTSLPDLVIGYKCNWVKITGIKQPQHYGDVCQQK